MENKQLMIEEREEILSILKDRFEKNFHRHSEILWVNVENKLINNERKLCSLYQMEKTGGEPDVIHYDSKLDEYVFYDCSAESPVGRRGLCYDNGALETRKEHRPLGSAIHMAESMGIEILTKDQYRELQQLGQFDMKTSSWLKTPSEIRELGGAIFGDFRYGKLFIYHNGAESYYSSRGFRGSLRV